MRKRVFVVAAVGDLLAQFLLRLPEIVHKTPCVCVAAATTTKKKRKKRRRLLITMATRIIGVVVPPLYHHSLGHDPPPPRLLTSSGCSRVAAFEERARGANGRGDNNSKKKNGGFLFPSSLSPSCKIRSRNSSANQKKPQARRVRGRPMPEVHSAPGEEGRESPVREQDIQNETSMDAESLSAEQQQRGSSSINSEGGGDEEGIFDPVSSDVVTSNGSMSDSSPKRKTGSFKDKGVSGVSVDELMIMMKDAENNIMLLNQVRERALEELQQVRNERDKLQSQVQVLQAQLGEVDAKQKWTVQAAEKANLLEKELRTLKGKLAEKEADRIAAGKLEEDYKQLQAHAQELSTHLKTSSSKGLELKQLLTQNQSSQDEINSLRVQLADAQAELATFTKGTERPSPQLQEYVRGLELKVASVESELAKAKASDAELALLENECQALKEEVAALRVQLAAVSGSSIAMTPEVVAQKELLQSKVDSLQTALAQAEAERTSMSKVHSENLDLRNQVQLLEQRLQDSDVEIRSQLRMYEEEVQAFQASLEGLKAEAQVGTMQIAVGEMPWDFWSSMMLQIEALMLDSLITQEDAKELRLMAWRREKAIRDTYVTLQEEVDEDMAAGLLDLIKPHSRPGLYIVNISAEMAPVAKVGGLGDVVTGLSRSLQRKGHLVEIILPKYDCMDYTRIKSLQELDLELHSFFDGQIHKNKVWSGIVEGLPVYFIEPLHPAKFFWRGRFYSEPDDFKRFTYFCRAALEFLLQSGKRPDVIHSHDWHTAVVAPLYWDIYVPLGLDSARLAFTCHNFEYQGAEPAVALASCGLSVRELLRPDRMQDNSFPNKINLLKGGIVFSNVVTTVSPTYAQEVLRPEGGKGLQGTLAQHSRKFYGVLNGIDDEAWNPATDSLLNHQYSADDLSGKEANKRMLRERLGLATQGDDARRPLVGCITRLVPQKGVHLIRHSIYRTLERGGQFILLGSSPIPHIQHEFEGIARQFENHPQIRLVLKYDEALSHSIYAACDIFVIPSIFEPCGLTQMIAMRYGSIPVVRETGGLADSVFDVDNESIPIEKRNGFSFQSLDEGGLNWALDRAMSYYAQNPDWWEKLVRKAMKIDFSWDVSADQYVDFYNQIVTNVHATRT